MDVELFPFRHVEMVEPPAIFQTNRRWRWVPPVRDYYNLWICWEGEAVLRCDGQDYRVTPGAAFLLPPKMKVEGFSTGEEEAPLRNFLAHWKPRGRRIKFLGAHLLGRQIAEIDTAKGLMQSLLRLASFSDELSRQQSEWALLQLLALLWREAQQPKASLTNARLYQQLAQMRSGSLLFTPVEELAKQAKLSRMHYTRRFQKLTGESPNRFQIRERTDRACTLLRQTKMTLEHIAHVIGYSDVFFFSRQFRREMKQSAAAYRREQVDL